MKGITIGFALCGSFCTFEAAISQMQTLVDLGYDLLPIMSPAAYNTDTRFGKAIDIQNRIRQISQNEIIVTIPQAEPIGPKKLADIMLISPCTSNTLAKLTNAITDTSVTMAAKSHLRASRPLLIALASNDALGTSAKNIGMMLNYKHTYFVPMSQDDPINKPNSLVAHFDLIPQAIESALAEQQLQPLFR